MKHNRLAFLLNFSWYLKGRIDSQGTFSWMGTHIQLYTWVKISVGVTTLKSEWSDSKAIDKRNFFILIFWIKTRFFFLENYRFLTLDGFISSYPLTELLNTKYVCYDSIPSIYVTLCYVNMFYSSKTYITIILQMLHII